MSSKAPSSGLMSFLEKILIWMLIKSGNVQVILFFGWLAMTSLNFFKLLTLTQCLSIHQKALQSLYPEELCLSPLHLLLWQPLEQSLIATQVSKALSKQSSMENHKRT